MATFLLMLQRLLLISRPSFRKKAISGSQKSWLTQLPAVGLPEAEYLELYNHSDNIINLKSLILSDPTASVALPDYELNSGAYAVLTSTSNAFLFQGENAVGVSNLPSLANGKDSLVISTVSGALIDQVVYTSDWYGDTQKDDGGYSLELISLESSCFGKANWTASTAEKGGTPGTENSVFGQESDSEAPMISSVEFD